MGADRGYRLAPLCSRPETGGCCREGHLLSDLARVERLLELLHELLLAQRTLFLSFAFPVLADRERDGEPPAGDLVESVDEQRRILGLLGEIAVKGGGRGELEGQRVAGELRRVGL